MHVFFLNGLDPFGRGNLPGLVAYVNGLGFKNTHYGEMYESGDFRKQIRCIRKKDSQARFALVGFSFGSNQACSLANDLHKDGIEVDLLVYLGGDTLKNSPEYRPQNVRQVVNITSRGYPFLFFGLIWDGVELDGAQNLRVTEAGHSDLPAWHQTHKLLAQGLAEVASDVPSDSSARTLSASRDRQAAKRR